ncbi:hypothetical protein [Blastomonas fulva]|uniref:Uncharacterized protein n=2 Tax=Blastomonas TaxID=150203 RepID=A0ABM6M462_9SPHN|nr:hypothetical protein [Blastomonas fulva]ASR50613.1 hypothetical protein B5J99_03300 [Blastomonas fulva]
MKNLAYAMSLALLAGTISAPVAAQEALAIGADQRPTLRAGTSVPLKTLTELTTKGKKLRVGDRFNLEVSEPVMVNGVTVIPVGSPAIGEITSVRNKGMWGKSGAIEVRMLYATVNGRQIRLSGATDDKGVTGTAGVVGAVVLLPIAGFFLTGTSAVIPAGSSITGFVQEDVPLSFAKAAEPAPMVVGTAAAAAVSATEQPVAAPEGPQ